MGKPSADKKWINFIDNFRQAHQELRNTDSTINELGFHNVNTIIEYIVDRLKE